MKIKKIEKLNHARYQNFNWNAGLQPFCDGLNILFGWNGSGKTTLSKIFRKIETGTVLGDCTFKIDTDSLSFSETDLLEEIRLKIRVFNEDYIESTLRGDVEIPYIFFAGKEAVDYSQEEKRLAEKKSDLLKLVLPITRDQVARNTATLIRGITGINGYTKELTGGNYASYDKSDFEKRFKNIQDQIKNNELSDTKELILSDIDNLKIQLVNSDRVAKNGEEIASASQWLVKNINNINTVLESTPTQQLAKRIDALDDREVAWVKEGVTIHFSDKKHDKCIFCNSDIKNSDELLKHFSDDVVLAINQVDSLVGQIENFNSSLAKIDSLTTLQKADIYKLRTALDGILPILREKRSAISVKINPIELDIYSFDSMATVIRSDASKIAYAIETHYVADQYEIYEKESQELDNAVANRGVLQKEIDILNEEVKSLKQKAKNIHESASALNTLFKIVFPYRKIEIADNDEGTGYILKRDGLNCPFSSLSEGEKNFIALAYFIYSINDAQNKLDDDGIVVIDDPVSSLDKQAIFQIFSIIANEIKKNPGRQYFIFTHNLDFLGHLKESFRKTIDQGKTQLMSFSSTNNGCVIGDLHPLLKNHRSDYYYTFSVLYGFKDTCSLEDSYLVVNLLRRWLETFLEFKFSTSGDFQSTLESAYIMANKATQAWSTPFNPNHLEMYRFINHGSHGFNDTESTDDSILTGASIRIQETLRLVEILDPMHYKKLEKLV